MAGALPSSTSDIFVGMAEDTVTSELLSVTNREKYRETSAEIINLSHVGAGSAHPSVS
jgi:hypothetical protein